MKRLLLLSILSLLVAFGQEVHAQGNCSQEDLLYIGNNLEFVQQVAADCGIECLFAGDPQTCFSDCMSVQVPLTAECVGCFSEQTDCASDNCFLACAFGSEADCAACIEANCLEGFNECAGIGDADADGFSNLSDCNDNDDTIYPGAPEIWYDGIDQNCDGLSDFDQDMDGADAFEYGGADCDDTDALTLGAVNTYFEDADNDGFGNLFESIQACSVPEGYSDNNLDCDDTRDDVYPWAPGTGDNVDNDCNGFVEGEEGILCVGDFDNDQAIGTNDLLIFLGGFGCLMNCPTDIDNDDLVTSSDLLIFLGAFGSLCQ